ncbi:MAG: signal recognition particle-docking protein FtsY, partial [Gemmatimonadota bacterium]
VELNPVTVSLLREVYAGYTGNLAEHERVTIVNGEGRSFLEQSDATVDLVDALEREARRGAVRTEEDLRRLLGERIRTLLSAPGSPARTVSSESPFVVLLVGVNGTGKTTTAARLARRALDTGETVLLAATDTFRSAAQEQLQVWAERLGTEFVGGARGGDPAAVAFDAAHAAVARGINRLIVDTAGRLHTQSGLMGELRKIDRVVERVIPGAPHERLLVVDATTGQNVLNQARTFGSALDLDGIVLAKFDSSARGGTAVAVARELGLPVRYLGVGESAADLEPFDADRYVEKLLA